jgi:hypothetical protein
VNCAVAAVGEFTGRVTFSVVSASALLPATITATQTVGGATLSVRVLVFSVTGQWVPHDNFGGRAADKLGVCEIVKPEYVSAYGDGWAECRRDLWR